MNNDLKIKARNIRESILKMTNAVGAGHVGGSLSEADILTALYFDVMRIDPTNPNWEMRDRFILSKGHATPGYYSTLALRGYFPERELLTFDQEGSRLQGHPDMHKTPGVDFTSGSLGQGLSAALGLALGGRKRGLDFVSFALMGDGEIQEGQIWEAAMYIGANVITHIVGIVDYNKVQLAETTEKTLPIEPLADKWRAFGLDVVECDGHDVEELASVLAKVREGSKKKSVIVIAHTVKGKGVSFMEGTHKWHGMAPNDYELSIALKEIGCE